MFSDVSLCLDVVTSCDNYASLGVWRAGDSDRLADGDKNRETVAEGPRSISQ